MATQDDEDAGKCVLCRKPHIPKVRAGSKDCLEAMSPEMRDLFTRTRARMMAEGLTPTPAGLTRALELCREEMGLK